MTNIFTRKRKTNVMFLLGVLLITLLFSIASTEKTKAKTWSDSGIRATSFLSGSGTDSNPFKISSEEELGLFSYFVNYFPSTYASKSYEITKSLNLSGNDWLPVNEFKGKINGNGFMITNIKISSSSSQTGFFKVLNKASIENLMFHGQLTVSGAQTEIGGIAGKMINGTSLLKVASAIDINAASSSRVGGLVGYVSDSTNKIEMSYNIASITASGEVGGLVGYSKEYLVIDNSYNRGQVSTKSDGKYIGGIIGTGELLTIKNSYNSANLLVGYSFMGGIAGSLTNSHLTNVVNYGDVTGGYSAAGIVGSASKSTTVTNASNEGKISSTYQSAGIAGGLYSDSTVSYASNTGNIIVTGTSTSGKAGGIVGLQQSDSSVLLCVNYGSVSGAKSVGGITATLDATTGKNTTISSVSNFGNITGANDSKVGGIIGNMLNGGTLDQSINSGNITQTNGSSYVEASGSGGLVGYAYTWNYNNINISDSFNEGVIGGGHNTGGLIGIIKYDGNSTASTKNLSTIGYVSRTTKKYNGAAIGRSYHDNPKHENLNFYKHPQNTINKGFGTNGDGTNSSGGKAKEHTTIDNAKAAITMPTPRTNKYYFNIGSAWEISSHINEGKPHLKDAYWQNVGLSKYWSEAIITVRHTITINTRLGTIDTDYKAAKNTLVGASTDFKVEYGKNINGLEHSIDHQTGTVTFTYKGTEYDTVTVYAEGKAFSLIYKYEIVFEDEIIV